VASLTFSSKFPKKPNSRIAKILESRKTSKLFQKSQNLESLESLPNSRIAQNKQTFQKSQILESLWILKSLKTSKLSKKVKSSNRYEFSNRSKQANFSKKVQLSNRTILKSQLSNRNSNRLFHSVPTECLSFNDSWKSPVFTRPSEKSYTVYWFEGLTFLVGTGWKRIRMNVFQRRSG